MKYSRRISLISLGLVFLCLVVSPAAPGADPTRPAQDPKPTIESIARGWQEHLGPVAFKERALFERMVYLHPRPEDAFTPFSGEVLGEHILVFHDLWVDMFFQGELHAKLDGLQPTGYYLNQGRTEPGLLLFKTEIDGVEVSIQENFNLMLLTVRPAAYRSTDGVPAAQVDQILTSWTRMGEGRTDAMAEFALPARLPRGHAFSNSGDSRIYRTSDWRRDVTGFVADGGLCFLLFKIDADAPRASVNLVYDFDWLDKWLFQADGETLVSTPADPDTPKKN